MSEMTPKKPSHIAYHVEPGKEGKNYWHKLGAMWPTKDGGYSLRVNAMPIDGEIALRPRELLEKMREERSNQPHREHEPEIGPSTE